MERYIVFMIGVVAAGLHLVTPASAVAGFAEDTLDPGTEWADAQRERSIRAITNKDMELAQSMFDEGWSPFFGFPPVQIYAGQIAAFDWPSRSWRRASLADYLDGSPNWLNMFALSEIPQSEGRFGPRPWANLECQSGFESRCLVAVTTSGFDKVRWLEIDASSGEIPTDGFDIPISRASVAWLDKDRLLVAIGLGNDDTGPSGYPLTVRLLERGEGLSDAPVIYRAAEDVDQVSVYRAGNASAKHAIIEATVGTRTVDVRLVDSQGKVAPLGLPFDANVLGSLGDKLLVGLLMDWNQDEGVWAAGSMVALDLNGTGDPALVLDARTNKWSGVSAASLGALFTADSAYLSILERGVKSVFMAQPNGDGWRLERVLGDGESIASLLSADPAGTTLLASIETALDAPRLFKIDRGYSPVELRQARQFFDPTGLQIERFTARAADGTDIPYWRIGPSIEDSEPHVPTILHGYGASNVPLLPSYAADVGRMWLSKGGAYIYAQVRGGGEYGANWYNAGHGANRGVPLQDFVTIAQDLVDRGLAKPEALGIDGTSDGERLVAGAALIRPDLFAAVVSRDGAVHPEAATLEGSPVLAEDFALIQTVAGRALADQYWPARLFNRDRGCAPIMFTSWRGDQRVPAAQSRSLAKKLQDGGCDVLLIEREGGEHAVTDAELIAMVFGYFSSRLNLNETQRQANTAPN